MLQICVVPSRDLVVILGRGGHFLLLLQDDVVIGVVVVQVDVAAIQVQVAYDLVYW